MPCRVLWFGLLRGERHNWQNAGEKPKGMCAIQEPLHSWGAMRSRGKGAEERTTMKTQLFFSWEAPTDTLQWISFVENSKKRWRKRNTDWKSVAKLRLMSQSTLKKKIRPYFIEAGINLQVNQSVQQLTDTDGFLFIHFYSYIFIHEFNFRFKNQYNYWKKCSNFILLSVVT